MDLGRVEQQGIYSMGWENVKWSSLLFAVSVPVHDDTGEMMEE